jgi:hypothetical protein
MIVACPTKKRGSIRSSFSFYICGKNKIKNKIIYILFK